MSPVSGQVNSKVAFVNLSTIFFAPPAAKVKRPVSARCVMQSISPAKRLRQLARGTRRGSVAPPDVVAKASELVEDLERAGWQGPGEGPLATDVGLVMLNGPWELVFQYSPSGTDGTKPGLLQRFSIYATHGDGEEHGSGRVVQTIDTNLNRITNSAETPWGRFRVEASFTPLNNSASEVQVNFDTAKFQLGPFPEFGVPISWVGGMGTLNTTYLSDEVRIGRGNKGTVFCLVRPDVGFN